MQAAIQENEREFDFQHSLQSKSLLVKYHINMTIGIPGPMPAPARFDDLAGDAIRLGELKAERIQSMRRIFYILLYTLVIVILAGAVCCVILDMLYGISVSSFFSSAGVLSLGGVLGISSSSVSLSFPAASTMTLTASDGGGIAISSSAGVEIGSDVSVGGDMVMAGDVAIGGTLRPERMNLTYSTIYITNSTKRRSIQPLNFSFARLVVSDLEFDSSYLNIIGSADVVGVLIDSTDVTMPQALGVNGLITAYGGLQSYATLSIYAGGAIPVPFLCHSCAIRAASIIYFAVCRVASF